MAAHDRLRVWIAAPLARRSFLLVWVGMAIFMIGTLALFSGGPLSAQSGTQTFVPRDESPEEFTPGPGREDAFYACTACHNFKLIAQQGLTRRQWKDSIDLMVRRHNMPELSEKDRRIVLDYLEAAYPPRAPAARPGWQNPFAPQ